MKKLDDIPKKEIFNVPEGYFEKLPGIIQARVIDDAGKRTTPVFGYALRYAAAASVIVIAALFWFRPSPSTQSPEAMLASVETADLVAYLDESDLTTDELMDELLLDPDDANGIEAEVYKLELGDDSLDDIMDEID